MLETKNNYLTILIFCVGYLSGACKTIHISLSPNASNDMHLYAVLEHFEIFNHFLMP